MIFTTLGKFAAGLCIVGGIAHYLYLVKLASDLGLAPYGPEMKQFMAGSSKDYTLVAFGLFLGVLCEISKSLARRP